ncbi:lysophospholipid acyltransferase family protein [Ohtaekwangia koreensis]|jgi:KDO2-lipid IV(A) lauroyltransferase|uniref:KDO2-lipid IV(A) lauroyltransferase n=1 Tax=Ohtaekwangia koreensis TaxID=688867 RepID=A0A1T5JD11_9BACT|nr:lysophospholipid acyltransferase family protein [Ohtaekwangia koreensis]SKC49295.1 KDO2-lipid IV(A) lauroyltransferase [Ohtaekwangia koreensis]
MHGAKKIRRKIRYTIVYRFVQFLIFISNRMPRVAWLKFCGFLGKVAYVFASHTRKLTHRHLTLAFKKEKSAEEIKRLSRKTFEYLGKNAGDILRASGSVNTWEDLQKFLVVYGFENYEAARQKGKGIIFLTCHLGAFDLQVTTMALRGLNPNIIGTPLKDERLNNLLWEYRNKHGAIPIERGRETFRMLKILKSGGSVALLIDQDTKVKSRFVNFFGKPAATPVGATVLAMKTGAIVVPTYIYLGKDWKQHMYILPEIPITVTGDDEADMVYNTQILTGFIEQQIREHPEQWVWMHERWKTKPGEEVA